MEEVNCTKCNAKTEVLETARGDKQLTRRRRRCTSCGSRFSTIEQPVGVKTEVTIIPADFADGFGKRYRKGRKGERRVDVEAIAAAIAVDRRKAAIAAEQRANRTRSEVYDDDDAAPTRLGGHSLRRELKGY